MKYLMILLVGVCQLSVAAMSYATMAECDPIKKVPVTISKSGYYCLTANQDYEKDTGHAIRIDADHVVLDLGGRTLSGLSAGMSTVAIGIYAEGHNNITVKNGSVTGFFQGIHLDGDGHLVEHIHADRNRQGGIYIDESGINIIIRNNRLTMTGGSTADVETLFGCTCVVGIFAGTGNTVIVNNDIIDCLSSEGHNPRSIWGGRLVVSNRIVNTTPVPPDEMTPGFGLYGSWFFRDNIVLGVLNEPLCGRVDAGNNFSDSPWVWCTQY